jgi:hypothetical protein
MPNGPGVVSGAQMAGAAAARLKGLNLYPSLVSDNENVLGDPFGGWDKGETPEAHSAQNLSTAQKPMAFRSPDSAGIGKNTIGTWQGFDTPWHQRYRTT